MRLAIVGSRTLNEWRKSFVFILECIELENITMIVSGGAKGADTIAEAFADYHNIKKDIYRAHWNTYGKRAGYLRNVDIVENSDKVIAFWNGTSKGTNHTINLAKKQNKLLKIIKI